MRSWLHPSSLLLPAGRLSGRRFRLRSDVSRTPWWGRLLRAPPLPALQPPTLWSQSQFLCSPQKLPKDLRNPFAFVFFNISPQNNMRNKRKKHGPISKLSQPEKQASVLPIPLSSGGSPRKKRGANMALGATTHLLVGRPHFPRTWVSS